MVFPGGQVWPDPNEGIIVWDLDGDKFWTRP